MKYSDLTNEQRLEYKQAILMERNDAHGSGTPYNDLANAGELVSDGYAEDHAEGVEFSSDDFSCGVAADRDGVLDELKEWAERELLMSRYAEPGAARRPTLEAKLGVDWARKVLLDHIEAVRS